MKDGETLALSRDGVAQGNRLPAQGKGAGSEERIWDEGGGRLGL